MTGIMAAFAGGGLQLKVVVDVNPMSASTNTATVTSASVTATASGGSGSYTYAWNKTGGDAITALTPSVASTAFRGTSMLSGENRIATFQCTATDTVTGQTAILGTEETVNISRP